MHLILEIDGPVLDVAPVWHRLHLEVVAAVGWSALDQATFWRLTRKHGREADLLRGAKPIKLKEYYSFIKDTYMGKSAHVDSNHWNISINK